MVLEVIGAGFAGTGALALAAALARLGFGPCHDWGELLGHPELMPLWNRAVDGAAIDWDAVLGGYRWAVGWPACHFWRELADRYPAAKVILTVREPQAWYRDVKATIFRDLNEPPPDQPTAAARWRLLRKMILQQTFGGSTADPELAIAVLKMHEEEVERAIEPERLLVHQAGQGWAPLCRFLGTAVPEEPYPEVAAAEEALGRS